VSLYWDKSTEFLDWHKQTTYTLVLKLLCGGLLYDVSKPLCLLRTQPVTSLHISNRWNGRTKWVTWYRNPSNRWNGNTASDVSSHGRLATTDKKTYPMTYVCVYSNKIVTDGLTDQKIVTSVESVYCISSKKIHLRCFYSAAYSKRRTLYNTTW